MDNNYKCKFWWFILYPESAPTDWKSHITCTGLPFAISPLHDKDKLDDGSDKKPHYHIILAYNGPTTFNNVKRLTVKELGQTIPFPISNMLKPYEYLWHKNEDPNEKFIYDPKGLELVNGFDISDYTHFTDFERMQLQSSICDDIETWKIQEYYSLVRIYQFMDYEKYSYVSSHSLFFKTYITSRKFVSKEECDLIESLKGDHDE